MIGDFNPWGELGLHCSAYSSRTDDAALCVMIGIANGMYSTDVAAFFGLDVTLVELLQEIICNAGWATYGTSPRGCYPEPDFDFIGKLDQWKALYLHDYERAFEVDEAALAAFKAVRS